MVHAKSYETVSTFVSYSEKTIGFFFLDTMYLMQVPCTS